MKDESHPILPHQVDRIVTEVKTQKISDEKLLSDYAVPTRFYVDENEDMGMSELIGGSEKITFRDHLDWIMERVRIKNTYSPQYFSSDMEVALNYAARMGDSATAFEMMSLVGADEEHTHISPEILVDVWEACQNHAYKLKTSGDQETAIAVLHKGIDLWQSQLEKLPLGSRLGRMLNRAANAQIV